MLTPTFDVRFSLETEEDVELIKAVIKAGFGTLEGGIVELAQKFVVCTVAIEGLAQAQTEQRQKVIWYAQDEEDERRNNAQKRAQLSDTTD